MSRRQHIMALCLAALLLALVLATAAKPPAVNGSAADEPKADKFAERLPADLLTETTKSKAFTKRVPTPFSSRVGQEHVWGYGAVYDLDYTSQASIYVLYTPASGK